MKPILLVLATLVILSVVPQAALADGGGNSFIIKSYGERTDVQVVGGQSIVDHVTWKVLNNWTSPKTVVYVVRFQWEQSVYQGEELVDSFTYRDDYHLVYSHDGGYEIRQQRIMDKFESGKDPYDMVSKYLFVMTNGEVRHRQRWIMGEKQF